MKNTNTHTYICVYIHTTSHTTSIFKNSFQNGLIPALKWLLFMGTKNFNYVSYGMTVCLICHSCIHLLALNSNRCVSHNHNLKRAHTLVRKVSGLKKKERFLVYSNKGCSEKVSVTHFMLCSTSTNTLWHTPIQTQHNNRI